MTDASDSVVGFLYHSDSDYARNETVCQIIERVEMADEGFGIEPSFRIRFADGAELEALGQQLSPWFPT